jgi:hypothetical protein
MVHAERRPIASDPTPASPDLCVSPAASGRVVGSTYKPWNQSFAGYSIVTRAAPEACGQQTTLTRFLLVPSCALTVGTYILEINDNNAVLGKLQ